ncbi:uncharacterized protein LTR77_010813 [Saxophila tyrrhenica]|uniref:AB hydrolase-1 domain-containing protein n=1 Tax=Saxophila tyrrhenica TaxID=1690608 RepID=A0AAV9NW25_9PEZI|nr:hypothetical protein LTR77_010813 [Saxophila tyrrhenica]
MSHLEVPGAMLYHEVVGSGPLLLCISGGDGSVENWRVFSDALKDHFTVVSWDRRGFSRSYITGTQDYRPLPRFARDADDAALLIQKYSPNTPATVIGNSSGGIVALTLLTRHPELIRTMIPYEPPIAKLCPDYEHICALHREIYSTYRLGGPLPAYKLFGALTKSPLMSNFKIDFSTPYLWSNMNFWFEREFMSVPDVDFDVEKDFGPHKDKLVPVYGGLSQKDAYQYQAMEVVCGKLALEYLAFPGEHIGQMTHAREFAGALFEALKRKDEYYAELVGRRTDALLERRFRKRNVRTPEAGGYVA